MVHRSSPPLNAARSPSDSSHAQDASGQQSWKKKAAKRLHKRDVDLIGSLFVAGPPYQLTIFDYAASIGVTLLPEVS